VLCIAQAEEARHEEMVQYSGAFYDPYGRWLFSGWKRRFSALGSLGKATGNLLAEFGELALADESR